ncbi:Uncharacterised protein [Klebsiella pneumoniae]|nr:Uncharacterised protein [Klebsiella pneumoniae]
MRQVDVQQRDAEYRTVGGDQRQEDPEQPVERRAGFPHHHFGELHHHGDHQDKAQCAQIENIQRDQDKGIHQPRADGGECHHKCGGKPHAYSSFQLFGDPHKGA